ncbi:MAG: nickel-dependent hydrogenase large subunit [Pseudomonadota bacterium]
MTVEPSAGGEPPPAPGATRLIAGPLNRVEGDVEIKLDVENGRVSAAYVTAPLFRGFERILEGKDPRDALTITPRICGICSVSQSMAAARALGAAQGVTPPENGLRAIALIHAAENLADHLTHFHLFFMPDFARAAYAEQPWAAEMTLRHKAQSGAAARAFAEARAQLMHVMGVLAGKWPHTLAVQPGGATKAPSARDKVRLTAVIRAFRAAMERDLYGAPLEEIVALTDRAALARWAAARGEGDLRLFLRAAETLDLFEMGRGPERFLSTGGYETPDGLLFKSGSLRHGAREAADLSDMTEDAAWSWAQDPAPRHPFDGVTEPDGAMRQGYSWCKAPRLRGETVEVGALARQAVDGHPLALELIRGGASVAGRVVGRLLESARLILAMEALAAAIEPGASFITRAETPDSARAVGLTEAARGVLGHWLVIERGRIANYQIVAPTTWNFSPRDGAGVPGPVEAALVGAPVFEGERTPMAVQHIVRSFDPCMVCTVH